MNSLPETALAFARECMGLAHVPAYDITDHVAFEFTNLTVVMKAARNWCDARAVFLTIESAADAGVLAVTIRDGAQNALGSFCDGDLCYALISTCLEAARKLKEQAA